MNGVPSLNLTSGRSLNSQVSGESGFHDTASTGNVNAGNRAQAFGHDLYANLRALDKAGCARILVQEVPGDERWDAIRDRIARAAVGAATDSGRYAAVATGVLP